VLTCRHDAPRRGRSRTCRRSDADRRTQPESTRRSAPARHFGHGASSGSTSAADPVPSRRSGARSRLHPQIEIRDGFPARRPGDLRRDRLRRRVVEDLAAHRVAADRQAPRPRAASRRLARGCPAPLSLPFVALPFDAACTRTSTLRNPPCRTRARSLPSHHEPHVRERVDPAALPCRTARCQRRHRRDVQRGIDPGRDRRQRQRAHACTSRAEQFQRAAAGHRDPESRRSPASARPRRRDAHRDIRPIADRDLGPQLSSSAPPAPLHCPDSGTTAAGRRSTIERGEPAGAALAVPPPSAIES
jgi:hypothetical protein